MKKVFANISCIIMVLENGETTTTDSAFLAGMTRELGPQPNGILSKMNIAHEIWLYNPATKIFYAWKNTKLTNEIIARMKEFGINVKVTAANMDGVASQVGFVDEKDLFHFKLKYL